MKQLIIISVFLFTASELLADSIPVRNRHSGIDTAAADTIPVDGGALIDTIHTDDRKELEKMTAPPDSATQGILRRSLQFELMASLSDALIPIQEEERHKKITDAEKDILTLKASANDMASKTAVADVENQKNDLKARLKNIGTDPAKWDADMQKLRAKLDELKNKSAGKKQP